MKWVVFTLLFLITNSIMSSQTVRQKDQWGNPLIFVDGETIKRKDQWGDALFYIDGQTIKRKDQWGNAIYFFEGIVEKWVLICLITDR